LKPLLSTLDYHCTVTYVSLPPNFFAAFPRKYVVDYYSTVLYVTGDRSTEAITHGGIIPNSTSEVWASFSADKRLGLQGLMVTVPVLY